MRPNSRSSFREASGTSNFPLPASRARTLRGRGGEIRWVVREKIEKAARWANRTGRSGRVKVGKGEERSGEPSAANHFSPGIGALLPILGFGRVRDRSCSFGHARTTRIKVAAVYLSPTASACIVQQHRRSVPSPRRLLVLISRIGFAQKMLAGSFSRNALLEWSSSGQFSFPRLIRSIKMLLYFFLVERVWGQVWEKYAREEILKKFKNQGLFGRWIAKYDA